MENKIDILNIALKNYVVTPLHAFGLGGFVFDVEGEASITLSTEITDHYLEDNSAIQDHIAIRPKKVTLKGFVGEVVFKGDESTEEAVQKVVQKLTIASALLPKLSSGASQVMEILRDKKARKFSVEGVNKIANYFSFVRNIAPPVSKQERAYLYFKALMESKILMSLQTPFEFMSNMAIESVTARQEEGSKYISDFSIVLKEIRKVSILDTENNIKKFVISTVSEEEFFQGRSQPQYDDLQQVGNMAGLPEGTGEVLDAHLAARKARQDELSQ